jgi:hypothetical protein
MKCSPLGEGCFGLHPIFPRQAPPKRKAGAFASLRATKLLLSITVRAFVFRTTMPSADFCDAVKTPCGVFSRKSPTHRRSPEVSSTAFRAQPPDLQPATLMDMGFAIRCLLARRRMPPIRFLSIGSRFCSTLPSDPTSRRRPCASLTLHLHQVE